MKQFFNFKFSCKLKIFAILLSIIMVFSFINSTTVAFAAASPIISNIIHDGGNSDGVSKYTLIIDDSNLDEINDFASIEQKNGNYVVESDRYVDNYVYVTPNKTENYNTIDYLLFMIGKLEDYAVFYLMDNDESVTNETINNLVLGYIRGLNGEYVSGYGGTWDLVCGEVNQDFYSYVNDKESNYSSQKLKTLEFFASYLQNSSSYTEPCGIAASDEILNKKYMLPDPLESGQTIDLLHMFAAIDGIYSQTDECLIVDSILIYGHQRDIVSWLGDLHQITEQLADSIKDINKIPSYNISLGHIDFNNYLNSYIGNSVVTKFPASDLLADIDAMNITKLFLDADNLLSECVAAYYSKISNDSATNCNRYYEFIYSVTRELERPSTGNMLKDFQNEVFNSMNIDYNNGALSDHTYYQLFWVDVKFLLHDGEFPDFEIRKCTANLFYKYIVEMSNRF